MAQVFDREQKNHIFLSFTVILQENLIHLCAKFKYYIQLLSHFRDPTVTQEQQLSRIHVQ